MRLNILNKNIKYTLYDYSNTKLYRHMVYSKLSFFRLDLIMSLLTIFHFASSSFQKLLFVAIEKGKSHHSRDKRDFSTHVKRNVVSPTLHISYLVGHNWRMDIWIYLHVE